MDDLEFSREEKSGVLRHEKAHSKGWDHGEGTPETNSAYYDDYDFARYRAIRSLSLGYRRRNDVATSDALRAHVAPVVRHPYRALP
jgi:hypothetical protein